MLNTVHILIKAGHETLNYKDMKAVSAQVVSWCF